MCPIIVQSHPALGRKISQNNVFFKLFGVALLVVFYGCTFFGVTACVTGKIDGSRGEKMGAMAFLRNPTHTHPYSKNWPVGYRRNLEYNTNNRLLHALVRVTRKHVIPPTEFT